MKSRREKVAALLHSPHEGERAAAEAALGRLQQTIPPRGSIEWNAGRRAYLEKVEFCLSRMGSSSLTPTEVRIIRMQARHRGSPWDRGADAINSIHEKLLAAEQQMLSHVQ